MHKCAARAESVGKASRERRMLNPDGEKRLDRDPYAAGVTSVLRYRPRGTTYQLQCYCILLPCNYRYQWLQVVGLASIFAEPGTSVLSFQEPGTLPFMEISAIGQSCQVPNIWIMEQKTHHDRHLVYQV